MDMLAAYGSDSDSEDVDLADVHAATAHKSLAACDDEQPIKRTRLEACRDDRDAPVQTQSGEQAVQLPHPLALLSNHGSLGPSTALVRYFTPDVHRISSGADAAAQAVSVTPATAAGTAVPPQQQNLHNLSKPAPPRVRSFPFAEGDWPTVVYVPVPDNCIQQLQQLAITLIAQCPKVPAAAVLTQPLTDAVAADTNTGTAADSYTVRSSAAANSSNGIAAAASPSTLRLWPTSSLPSQAITTSSGNGSNSSGITAGADPQQQQQQQQDQPDQQLPLHMSLSRTLPIKYIQIASLKAALTKQLKGFKPFKVELRGLACLVNDAGTRSFVCIKVAKGHHQVVRLLGGVNRAFIIHGLQTFYQDPLPHVSLAWAPGDQRHLLQPWLDSLEHDSISMLVSHAVCQTGKDKTTVWKP